MIKADLTRRAAFKLSGGGLLAGFLGGANAKMPRPAFVPDAGSAVPGPPLRDNSYQLFERIKARMSWENHKIDGNRGGYFDPDIACLKSVSPAMKCWMQRDRDDQARDWKDALYERICGS